MDMVVGPWYVCCSEAFVPHHGEKPIANPYVMLREEFDDWAVLFNPDTGHGFGLSPTGVYLWKLLDGEHAIDGLLDEIRRLAEGVPEEARDQIGAFIDALVTEGLAGYGDKGAYREKCCHAPLAGLNEVKPFTYEPPKLIDFTGGRAASGTDCYSQGSHGGNCTSGAGATGYCCGGTCGTPPSCCGGTCDGADCQSGGNPLVYPCGYGSSNPVMCNCYSYGANATSCQYGTNAGSCSTGNST